jgi:CBS domain containing-hemolysin-like protein
MVRCSCCEELVAAVVEAPRTKQPVCARCLKVIRGMVALWDVLATTKERKK